MREISLCHFSPCLSVCRPACLSVRLYMNIYASLVVDIYICIFRHRRMQTIATLHGNLIVWYRIGRYLLCVYVCGKYGFYCIPYSLPRHSCVISICCDIRIETVFFKYCSCLSKTKRLWWKGKFCWVADRKFVFGYSVDHLCVIAISRK